MVKRKIRILSIFLAVAMVLSVPAFAVSVRNFEDVPEGAWYCDAVEYAVSGGLFNGTSSTTFSPEATMTRGMFVTVLGRLNGVEDSYGRTLSTPFNDITQADYFFPYAVWANDNGIVTGVGGNTFNPHGEITREQIATILYRYADKFGYVNDYSSQNYATFSDTASVSDYAVNAMQWATTHDIINGSDGMLNPKDYATRAQVAQMFLNFSQLGTSEPQVPIEPETPDWENYNPIYDVPTGKSEVDSDGGYYDYDLANEIMAQVNALRVEHGLDALLYHPQIQEWAGVRAKEQTVLFSHTRPNGTDCVTVGQGLCFENLARSDRYGENWRDNPKEAAAVFVSGWYDSISHRQSMLSSAAHLGAISCYVKGDNVYICHLFSMKTLYYMDYLI